MVVGRRRTSIGRRRSAAAAAALRILLRGSLSKINRYLTVTPTEKEQKTDPAEKDDTARGLRLFFALALVRGLDCLLSLLIIDILPYLRLSTPLKKIP